MCVCGGGEVVLPCISLNTERQNIHLMLIDNNANQIYKCRNMILPPHLSLCRCFLIMSITRAGV